MFYLRQNNNQKREEKVESKRNFNRKRRGKIVPAWE